MEERRQEKYKNLRAGNLEGVGRKQGRVRLTDSLLKILEQEIGDGESKYDKVAAALYARAISEDPNAVAAIKLIFDRVDGPVVQKSELTGADGGPIRTGGYDLSKLKPGELEVLLPLLQKLETVDPDDEDDLQA